MEEKAKCRSCRMELRGKPYYMGGHAYHPETGEECKSNFYGGYVCSEGCDIRACQELENSMPGSTPGGNALLSCQAKENLKGKWIKQE